MKSGKPENLILGQLICVRDFNRQKFDANTKRAIFAGHRLDRGSNYKGIDLVLDCQSLKDQTAGYQIPSSVRCEEVFVPEGAPVMPLYSASQTALAEFGEKNLEPVPNIDVPFSSLEPTALPRERNEYITLDWLIKCGGTPGCGACCLQGPVQWTCES